MAALFVFVMLVVILAVIFASLRGSQDASDLVRLTRRHNDAIDAIDNIRALAVDYHDVSPVFSDSILAEIRKFDRKELGPHG